MIETENTTEFEIKAHIKTMMAKRAEIAEGYAALYLQHTGLQPDQIVLVEKHTREDTGIKIEWYFEPKSNIPTPPLVYT